MYYLNKFVDGLVNPFALGVLLLVVAALLLARGRKKLGGGLLGAGFAWLWIWSMPITASLVGYSLESQWPPCLAETVEEADAIVLLGGGMNACPEKVPYPNICSAADRVWHAARLYKAGKAPLIIPTGVGATDCERVLLEDFGVPAKAIVCEDEARNTEENARFVKKLLAKIRQDQQGSAAGRVQDISDPKILLVTSALHMPRAKMMYERYAKGLTIVPSSCDHESTIAWKMPLRASDFVPNVYSLATVSFAFKEYLGAWGYRLLRR